MARSSVVDLTSAARQAADAAAAARWAAADPDDVLLGLQELAGAHRLIEAALVEATDRAEATDAAKKAGWASTKDLLTHLLGGHRGAGAGIVRLAENTRALAAVRAALIAGEISAAQARVIGRRVATLPHDDRLRERAADIMVSRARDGQANATDLDHGFSSVVDEIDPDRQQIRDDREREKNERGVHHSRFLSFSEDAAGGIRIRGYASVEDVELVKSCLLPLAAPQATEPGACGGTPSERGGQGLRNRDAQGRLVRNGCPDPRCLHDGRDPRDSGARLWDAVVDGCRRLMAAGEIPLSHGVPARIVVTVPLDDLSGRVGARGLLSGGEALSVAAVRRLACDADVIPAVLGSKSELLDLGASKRTVTSGQWTALVLRDGHCAFPGCERHAQACDAHHIVHWADGGPSDLDNLILLCRHHHTTVHHTPWTVSIDLDTGRPRWIPPRLIDDRDRFTYRIADAGPPGAAA